MKKVLITGACGQVGSHVAEMLLARGDKVLGIDNFATGKRYHLPESHPNLQFVEGTISDRALVEKLFSEFQPDVVVHTAASYKDPEDFYNDTLTNAVGGTNLIRSAKDHKTTRFIYFQTALCYGTKPLENPITLKHPKFPANSSYAISKTVCEDYLEISGLDYVSFRLANVIGPRNVSGPLPIFFQRLSSGKKCFVTTSRRDFVYVKDLARIVLEAIDGKGKGAYHFSSGKDMEIKTLYDAVVKAMKLDPYPAPDIKDLGDDDAKSILLDPSRTFADFGNIQFTPLDELVSAAVEYFSKYGSSGGYTHLKIEEKDK
jgi:nucleoside-diphosphate-sugar epimerase